VYLCDAHQAGTLQFFGEYQGLAEPRAFADWFKPLRHCEWVVYAKRPFAGPDTVLAYLSRYTHRVAIANSRLIAMDEQGITFKWKDYRAKDRYRHKTMTLAPDEFIRRFLLHDLPAGLHRIGHYGLFANTARKDNLAQARDQLKGKQTDAPTDAETNDADTADTGNPDASATFVCPDCGAAMIIIESFEHGQLPRSPPRPINAS
jgi:Putative transposase